MYLYGIPHSRQSDIVKLNGFSLTTELIANVYFWANLPALSFSLWAQLAVIRFAVLNDTIPQDSDRLMGYGFLMSWQCCLSLLFSHKTQAGVWWDRGFGPCHSGEWMTRHLGPVFRLAVTDVSRFMWLMLEVNVNNTENNCSCAETASLWGIIASCECSLLTQTLYQILTNAHVTSSQWFCSLCCFASRPMDTFPWYSDVTVLIT